MDDEAALVVGIAVRLGMDGVVVILGVGGIDLLLAVRYREKGRVAVARVGVGPRGDD